MWANAAAVCAASTLTLAVAPLTGPGERRSAMPPEPDGMLVLSRERAMVADPHTGQTTARELPGGTLCHGPLLAAGGRMPIFGVDGRRVVAQSMPLRGTGHAVSPGPADTVGASSKPGRLWLGRWTRLGTRTGRLSLREVDAADGVVTRTRWLLPRCPAPVRFRSPRPLRASRRRRQTRAAPRRLRPGC